MKNKLIIITLFCLPFFNFCKGQALKQIIEFLTKEANKYETAQFSTKDLVTKTIVVNSASKARFSGGKTRDVVKISLPSGTKQWYYRITILDVNSTYSYQENETFNYLLKNKKAMSPYAPTNESIDFYILGHSGDVESFKKTGNNNFKSFKDYTRIGTNSFVGYCSVNQENLWIGIKNPNMTVGLKVIVEVVSWGKYD
ncbi:MAG: hypothetical protein AB7O73_10860 [Bacteroidia bacterium]